MADLEFHLDKAAVGRLLKSPAFAALANDAARRIAANVGEDAQVSEYTTDRAAASVSVPAYRQARDGALTRAASAAGLSVRAK